MENTRVGPFLIVKRLGTNRRQKVFHARQVEQERDVALKFISIPPEVGWSTALSKIQREVGVLKQLQHPNLVRVYGAGAHEEQIFFANELIKGESLAAILARRGKLTPDLAVEYGKQISSLLEYLHNNEVIHSKLTPEKIMITKDHQVKVSDLRLNRSRKRRWDSTRRRELDIAAYMAPEQFTEGATHKSDFYSLGVILFEILSGKLPYPPDTLGRMARSKLNSPVPSVAKHVMNCPIWLDQIVTQMLQPDPRQRPHSARAIAFAFQEIKNIDQTKQAAVAQVSGKFNPLNAGKDKSEANRLLGKKTKKRESEVSFFQSIPFLVGCLVLIAALIGFAMMPPSTEKVFAEAQELMDSQRLGDWRRARSLFEQVIERNDNPDLVQQAEEGCRESLRRALVKQAEQGIFLKYQSANTKIFGEAFDFQKKGQNAEALELFEQLVKSISDESEELFIRMEAQTRIDSIMSSEPALPTDTDDIKKLIESWVEARTRNELKSKKRMLARLIVEFAGKDEFSEVVSQAKTAIASVDEKLELLAIAGEVPSEDETTPGELPGDDPANEAGEEPYPGENDEQLQDSSEAG